GRGDFQVADTRAIRTSWRVLVTGAFLTTLMDLVIDPLTVRGERWFLGRIYYYPEGGIHFGVPLSNYAGWFLVAAASIAAFQALEPRTSWSAAGVRLRSPGARSSTPRRRTTGSGPGTTGSSRRRCRATPPRSSARATRASPS